mgnify:CR=1 FL=1
MAVLLLAEITDGALSMDATAKAVTAAQALGEVTVLAAGSAARNAAEAAATAAASVHAASVPAGAPVTTMSPEPTVSASVEPVDCAKAGTARNAVPTARLLAAVLRTEWNFILAP